MIDLELRQSVREGPQVLHPSRRRFALHGVFIHHSLILKRTFTL